MSDLAYLRSCLSGKDKIYLQRAHFSYTQSGRHETQKMLARIPHYEKEIDHALQQYDIPAWIKYLPLAESRLQAEAVSPAGAAGLWQIMPATGRSLGLRVNKVVDERLHTGKASMAAARYLKKLHDQFGDWLLALAAYNCGPGNVRKAQRRSRGYFYHEISRYLPRQTQRYIPRFLTIATIAEQPQLHGFDPGPNIHAPVGIKCSRATDLSELANYYRCTVRQMERLNPAFLNGAIPLEKEATAKIYIPFHAYHNSAQIGVFDIAAYIRAPDPEAWRPFNFVPRQHYIYAYAEQAEPSLGWHWLLAFRTASAPG